MAAAVSCGRTTPGSRKTTTWEKDLLLGSVYRNDVGEGVDTGSVMTGQPVGMMPKAGVDILEVVYSSKTGRSWEGPAWNDQTWSQGERCARFS